MKWLDQYPNEASQFVAPGDVYHFYSTYLIIMRSSAYPDEQG